MNETYESIFNEWESELGDMKVKIFQSLRRVYPNSRTRRQLIFDVYGLLIPNTVDLNNNKYDRKIRLTIAQMQDDLIPVVSSSSKAGYRLDMNPETIRKMGVEFSRRITQYERKVNRANMLLIRIQQTREVVLPTISTKPLPRQMKLEDG